jgi:hypothetical protein
VKARARSRYRRICYGEGHPPEDGLRRFEFLLVAYLTFIIADNFFRILPTKRLFWLVQPDSYADVLK